MGKTEVKASTAMGGVMIKLEWLSQALENYTVTLEGGNAGVLGLMYRDGRQVTSLFDRDLVVMHSEEYPYRRYFNWEQFSSLVENLFAISLPERSRIKVTLIDYNPNDLGLYNNSRIVQDDSLFSIDWWGIGYLMWKCTKVYSLI